MTLTLYYRAGACSLSPHIVLRELGLPFELQRADRATGKTTDGTDFATINPKGYVPAIKTDGGEILLEGPAIVQYLADQKPEAGLAPKWGTFERYRLQEWLNFLTSEIHKGFSPLFRPTTPEDYKTIARANLEQRLGWVEEQLQGKPFLMGDTFSVADAYLFTMLNWTKPLNIALDRWPAMAAYHARIAARPAVQEALKAEGLIK
jgi:glutathione S-transferase